MYWDFKQNVLYVSIDEFKLYYVMLERSVNEGSQYKHCIISVNTFTRNNSNRTNTCVILRWQYL